MATFEIDDLAHTIVHGKSDIIESLRSIGLIVSDHADDEWVFRLVLENQEDLRVQAGIRKVLIQHPYHRHCSHCVDAIRDVYRKGIVIKKSINDKKSNG